MFASLRESRQVVTGESVQLCVRGALVLDYMGEFWKLVNLSFNSCRNRPKLNLSYFEIVCLGKCFFFFFFLYGLKKRLKSHK